MPYLCFSERFKMMSGKYVIPLIKNSVSTYENK